MAKGHVFFFRATCYLLADMDIMPYWLCAINIIQGTGRCLYLKRTDYSPDQ